MYFGVVLASSNKIVESLTDNTLASKADRKKDLSIVPILLIFIYLQMYLGVVLASSYNTLASKADRKKD
jgi:hypothetical protein